MTQQYAVGVQTYTLGPRGLSLHSAIEFRMPGFSVCYEAMVQRKFQCALCDDAEWRRSGDMQLHFQSHHAGHLCTTGSGRFVKGVFRTEKQFVLNHFHGQNTCCSRAKLRNTQNLGIISISNEGLRCMLDNWVKHLNGQKYDESANNCNHQVEKWCKDLRHLGIRPPSRFTNLPARLAFAWFGPVQG